MFTGLSETLSTVLLVGSVLLALTLCFFAFRLVRFWTAFIGFLAGFIAGIRIARMGIFPEDAAWYLPVLFAAVAGIIVSLLSYKLFKAGVFVFCGTIAWYALATILHTDAASGELRRYLFYAVQGAAFVLAGYLAVKFMRAAIIVLSAVGGAWTAAHGLGRLLPQYLPDQLHVLGLFTVLAGAGLLIKYLTTRE